MSNGVRLLNENDDIKKIRDEGYIVIGVHNGMFHCDDVFACSILELFYENISKKINNNSKTKKLAFVRTRNKEILKKCELCVDVGGGEFDHHFPDFDDVRSNDEHKTKYASAGLVWRACGKLLIKLVNENLSDDKITEIYNEVDKNFIKYIDADDNGQLLEKKLNSYEKNDSDDKQKYYSTFYFDFIKLFNPSWHDTKSDFDENFKKAVELTKETFNNCLRSLVLGEQIEEVETINSESDEQFIANATRKYQNEFLKNFHSIGKKLLEDNFNVIYNKITAYEIEELEKIVNENVRLFLKQHSLEYNSTEQKKEIIEQKIRQIVDEIYATIIIEELIEKCGKKLDHCLIIPSQTMPWKKAVCEYNLRHSDEEKIQFVIYPHPNGGYACECVPKSINPDDRYTKITPLLSEIPDEYKDIIEFLHKNRFFARTFKDIPEDKAIQTLHDLCEKSIDVKSNSNNRTKSEESK